MTTNLMPPDTAPDAALAAGPRPRQWSARPVPADAAGPDRDAALEFFTETDFHYRTAEPATRPEWEVLGLLGESSRLLLADGRPVGLYDLENIGSDHGCHYGLTLRLSAAVPIGWWEPAFTQIVRALRWQREVVRLTHEVYEFDTVGLGFARGIGLTEEGTLDNIVRHRGRSWGHVFFSRIWAPAS